jgi:hypothetical protein
VIINKRSWRELSPEDRSTWPPEGELCVARRKGDEPYLARFVLSARGRPQWRVGSTRRRAMTGDQYAPIYIKE